MSTAHKATVQNFYRRLWSTEAARAVAECTSPDYIEHQASAGFSRWGLVDYVQRRRAAYPQQQMVIHRTIAQGSWVFVHVEERLDEEHAVARGELFRLQRNEIQEHWSAHVKDRKPRKNPNGTFDGPDVDLRKDSAARFVTRFQELDLIGFGEFDFAAFLVNRTERYIEHSPTGCDGRAGLIEVLQKIAAGGARMSVSIKHTLVEGDFIVSHRLYRTRPPYPDCKTINVFDLFRMTDEGQADEHWDIMEEIESESEAHLGKIF